MTYRSRRSSGRGTQRRYRAVASWRRKIDVEALARVLLVLALQHAEQEVATAPGASLLRRRTGRERDLAVAGAGLGQPGGTRGGRGGAGAPGYRRRGGAGGAGAAGLGRWGVLAGRLPTGSGR